MFQFWLTGLKGQRKNSQGWLLHPPMMLATRGSSQTNFAKWEPWHGKFGLYYPWGKYLQLGDHLRELASSIISLTNCLQYSKQI
ncbi:hypothetical protein G4B88_017364 [Cannabis sativa]|uniref:Uncharacterized protein n=1 Tax=Cannabis sativa TaxID=3483 RepID=A0A7J6ESU7_CANSA|nr:hypothetical protein G4B88_017364 [Cannabis sativa]